MVISLEIFFYFTYWGTALNISGKLYKKNGCGRGKKQTKIYQVQFCEMELGVLVDSVYGRDLQLKLVKEVMIQGMVGVFPLQSYDTK